MKPQKNQNPKWVAKVGEMLKLNKKREKTPQQLEISQEKPNEESSKTS